MAWKIKVTYDTGDSFTVCNDVEKVLDDYEWEDLEAAQAALQRLREHYLWCESRRRAFGEDLNQPEWLKRKVEDDWKYDLTSWFNAIGDYGEEIWIYSFYIGHFETLKIAEIVSTIPEDDKNRIYF